MLKSHSSSRLKTALLCVASAAMALTPLDIKAESGAGNCVSCDDCSPVIAIKTNLIHDALLTPDLGVELSIARRFSFSLSGSWAWWSRESSHRYWRIYGGNARMSMWLGDLRSRRALSGHHLGLYASAYTYDFEFGGKGRQASGPTYSTGVVYGYSIPLNQRLNLDISASIGYIHGDITEYHPRCGKYSCTSLKRLRYFGPSALEISLVWFPGRNSKNSPNYNL